MDAECSSGGAVVPPLANTAPAPLLSERAAPYAVPAAPPPAVDSAPRRAAGRRPLGVSLEGLRLYEAAALAVEEAVLLQAAAATRAGAGTGAGAGAGAGAAASKPLTVPAVRRISAKEAKFRILAEDIATGRRGAFLERLAPALVGEATTFLSYAQDMPLAAIVATAASVDARLRASDVTITPFFWWDLAVLDQHAADTRGFEWFQREFRESVRAIGHTALVLEWERPLPLERLWCVWEMFCSVNTPGLLFEVAMPPDSYDAFELALVKDFDSLADKLCSVNLREADAWHGGKGQGSCRSAFNESTGRVGCPMGDACPDERRRILEAVEAEVDGTDGVTKVVIGAMRTWMVCAAQERLTSMESRDERAGSHLQLYLARLLHSCGRLSEAETLLQEQVEVRRRTLGNRAHDTLASICSLGGLLKDRGKLDLAEPLLYEVLTMSRDSNNVSNLVVSINSLCQLLQARGDLDVAEPLYREALAASRESLGSMHRSTLSLLNNLGGLLQARGNQDGAEPLLHEALAGMRCTLGDAHPSTLASLNNIGKLLNSRGDFAGAELFFLEALAAKRRTLGDEHHSTLVSINDVGLVLQDRGELDRAEPLLREALSARRRTLGDAHQDTLASISNLGQLLQDRGDLDGAEPLLREALAGMRRGARATEVLKAARTLASLLVSRDFINNTATLDEAVLLAEEAFEGLLSSLGEAHLSTLIALRVRGRARAAQGDLASAVTDLRASLDGLQRGNYATEAHKSALELDRILKTLPGADSAVKFATALI
jgi:tetratricopeptide (TPR) repeat protein